MSHYFAKRDGLTKLMTQTEFVHIKHFVCSGWSRSVVVACSFLLLAGIIAPTSWAQTPETLRHFDEGNTLYSEGR